MRSTRVLLIVFCLQLSVSYAGESAGADKPSWQSDWEKTVQAAKQEGQLFIYAAVGPYHPDIFTEFQKDYPEIKANVIHGHSSRISPRLLAEQRAGKYLADVYMGGPSSLCSFYRSKLFDPITSLFVLPEVSDPSKWWEGKHYYIDPEGKFIFVNEGSVFGFTISYNTQLAKAEEFRSYWDLFNPKWRERMVSLDACEPGFGASELRYVPVSNRRVAGRKYFFVEGPEFMDVAPAVKIIDEALAGKSRPQ